MQVSKCGWILFPVRDTNKRREDENYCDIKLAMTLHSFEMISGELFWVKIKEY